MACMKATTTWDTIRGSGSSVNASKHGASNDQKVFLRIYRRVRAGFSLPLLVAVTVSLSFVLARATILRPHILLIVIGIALMGLTLLAAQFIKARASESDLSLESDVPEQPLAFLRSLGYWGCILLASAVPIFYFAQYLSREQEQPSQPPISTNTPPVVELPTPAPVAPPPMEFPKLRISGVSLNGARSTVVINGRTLAVGENIGGAEVLTIEQWGITVAFAGRSKSLGFGF